MVTAPKRLQSATPFLTRLPNTLHALPEPQAVHPLSPESTPTRTSKTPGATRAPSAPSRPKAPRAPCTLPTCPTTRSTTAAQKATAGARPGTVDSSRERIGIRGARTGQWALRSAVYSVVPTSMMNSHSAPSSSFSFVFHGSDRFPIMALGMGGQPPVTFFFPLFLPIPPKPPPRRMSPSRRIWR